MDTRSSATAGAPDSKRAATIREFERLARLLDTQWRIPGTNIRFGLDPIVGLAPGIGDVAAGLVSGYIVILAARLKLPRSVIARMIGNVGIDVVFGSVPLLGSIFDLFYKANRRNLRLLQQELERERGG
jgi:hypothetical protein